MNKKKALGTTSLGKKTKGEIPLPRARKRPEGKNEIPIESIIPNPYQPRIIFNLAALKELEESIKIFGVLEPIIVRPIGDKYQIVIGERRWRACKNIKMKTIPCFVRKMSEAKSFECALTENVQRDDLSAIEEARAYKKMIDEKIVKNQSEVARRIGVSRARITQKMQLLQLPKELLDQMLTAVNKSEYDITERHLRPLIHLKDKEKQFNLFNKIVEEGLPSTEVEKRVDRILSPRPPESEGATFIRDIVPGVSVRITPEKMEIKIKDYKGKRLISTLETLLQKAKEGELTFRKR